MKIKGEHIDKESRICLGDVVMFTQIFKSYYHPLCYYASNFIPRDNAEDIIENLFLKLWNRQWVFNDKLHLQAFLYQSVHNGCLDLIKTTKNKTQRESLAVGDEITEGTDQLNLLIKAEVLGEIYREVNNLPSQCSKVIRMGYLEGLSNSEIAAKLGLSEQTVKNYKRRGLSILKDKLSGTAFTMLLLLVHWK